MPDEKQKFDDLDEALLDSWDALFKPLSQWNFNRKEQIDFINALAELFFAITSYQAQKKQPIDADSIAKIIEKCQQKRYYAMNPYQLKRFCLIETCLMAFLNSACNPNVYGKPAYNFFVKCPQNSMIYMHLMTITRNISQRYHKRFDNITIKDISAAHYLMTLCTNTLTPELDRFEDEEYLFNFCQQTMYLLCLYVIEHPYQTIINNNHPEVAILLEQINDLLMEQHSINPKRRAIVLMTLLQKYNKGDIGKIIGQLNFEFFSGKKIIQIIGSDPSYKLNYQIEDNVFIKPRISLEKIEKQRNKIPFEAIRHHCNENHTQHLNIWYQFINWFFNFFYENKLKKEIQSEFNDNEEIKFAKNLPFFKIPVKDTNYKYGDTFYEIDLHAKKDYGMFSDKPF